MNIDQALKDMRTKFSHTLQHFTDELSKTRSGRVSTSLVEHIKVDAYGSPMPLNQVASINVPDPKSLVIEPWDKSLMADVEKALLKSDLGITPTNDGSVLRLNFPPLSEDRRKEFVKVVKKHAEDAKVALRTTRRETLDVVHKYKKEMSEDDMKKLEETIQKELTAQEKKINDLTEHKTAELMRV